MTTPGILANRATHGAHAAQRAAISAQLTDLTARHPAAQDERVEAAHAQNRARGRLKNAEALHAAHRDLAPLLPSDPRRDERLAREAADLQALRADHLHASAWAAAARTAEDAIALEMGWRRHRIARIGGPTVDGRFEPVSGRAEAIVVGQSYESVVRRGDREPLHRVVDQRGAVAVIDSWRRAGARILHNPDGILRIVAGEQTIELTPNPLSIPPNEGAVASASLSAYGWTPVEFEEGGATYVVVPLDRSADDDQVFQNLHVGITSGGEVANRPIHLHDEPWVANLYDGEGAWVSTLYEGDPRLSLPADSAACARAVADYAARPRN
ncbi:MULTISPECIES: hypothetical protein [unclassified Streptomyces]|uniref:hypothetical protein n=1 Tax=unclassified Streptomyces TaxID=2593676 RepID=UPI003330EA9A